MDSATQDKIWRLGPLSVDYDNAWQPFDCRFAVTDHDGLRTRDNYQIFDGPDGCKFRHTPGGLELLIKFLEGGDFAAWILLYDINGDDQTIPPWAEGKPARARAYDDWGNYYILRPECDLFEAGIPQGVRGTLAIEVAENYFGRHVNMESD